MPRRGRLTALKVKQDSTVAQGGLTDDGEKRGEGLAEGGFSDVGIEGIATAEQKLKHWIRDGHPLENEMTSGEIAAHRGDAVERDLAVQQQVMNDGEHHHGVKVT